MRQLNLHGLGFVRRGGSTVPYYCGCRQRKKRNRCHVVFMGEIKHCRMCGPSLFADRANLQKRRITINYIHTIRSFTFTGRCSFFLSVPVSVSHILGLTFSTLGRRVWQSVFPKILKRTRLNHVKLLFGFGSVAMEVRTRWISQATSRWAAYFRTPNYEFA